MMSELNKNENENYVRNIIKTRTKIMLSEMNYN